MYSLVKFKLYNTASFTFQPNKVPAKIYISSLRPYFVQNKNVPRTNNSAPRRGGGLQFENLSTSVKLVQTLEYLVYLYDYSNIFTQFMGPGPNCGAG
jgi:hypothetical protein